MYHIVTSQEIIKCLLHKKSTLITNILALTLMCYIRDMPLPLFDNKKNIYLNTYWVIVPQFNRPS